MIKSLPVLGKIRSAVGEAMIGFLPVPMTIWSMEIRVMTIYQATTVMIHLKVVVEMTH